MTQVFISYSEEDSEAATELAQELSQAGLNPWLDQEPWINAGEAWAEVLSKAIAASDCYILLLSSHCISNGALSKDLEVFLNRLFDTPHLTGKFLIPVRLEDVALPLVLSALQPADMFPSWDSGFTALVHSIKARAQLGLRSNRSNRVGAPAIVIAWDPEALDQHDYADLVSALGDLARAEGGVGIQRLRDATLEVTIEAGVLA
jgi:hypothetical protein